MAGNTVQCPQGPLEPLVRPHHASSVTKPRTVRLEHAKRARRGARACVPHAPLTCGGTLAYCDAGDAGGSTQSTAVVRAPRPLRYTCATISLARSTTNFQRGASERGLLWGHTTRSSKHDQSARDQSRRNELNAMRRAPQWGLTTRLRGPAPTSSQETRATSAGSP